MEKLLTVPFRILEIPNIKIKKTSWMQAPSAMTAFSVVLISYFLVTAGTIHIILRSPPSVGTRIDEHGQIRPEPFMPRLKSQYIMEGIAAGFMFTIGGVAFILFSVAQNPAMSKFYRMLLISVSFLSIFVAYFSTYFFMKMKVPLYLKAFSAT